MNYLLLSALGLSISASAALAQELVPTPTPSGIIGNVSITNQNRFMGDGVNKRFLQSNLTIKGSIDLNGLVQIHTLIQSGNNYSVGFNNIYNFNSNEFLNLDVATQMHIKRLYLKKSMMKGKLSISAGAMDTRNTISQANALSVVGWIDGARAELNTKLGTMMLTTGQINAATIGVIDRVQSPSNLNYFEITMSKKVFENLLVEGGVETYKDNTYIQAASKFDIEVATNKVIKLVGDAKFQTNTNGLKFGAGIQDILSLFSNKISDVKLAVNYEYVSPKFNADMHKLANTMHTGYTGGVMIATAQYPIYKKYGITGVTSLRIGNQTSDFRLESGIAKTIFNKTYKRKAKKQ